MKEFRVKVSVRNNLLLSAVEAAGYKTQAEFCRATGVTQLELSKYVTFREAPIANSGEFRESAKRIMEALGACPTDLWTEQQLFMELHKNKSIVEMTYGEALAAFNHGSFREIEGPEAESGKAMLARSIDKILDEAVRPREGKILRLRYGIGCKEHSMHEVAKIFDVSVERVRQIECTALRKLRHEAYGVERIYEDQQS